MRSRIKRSAMFCAVTACRPHRRASTRRPGRHSFGFTWRFWRHRLFHSGGPHAAWAGDLLRAVLYPSREPQGGNARDHYPPRVKTLPLPARSPNLNAYAERWVRSVKEECLSKIIVFGERSLRRALSEYVAHYQAERNHQGKSNVLLFRRVTQTRHEEPVQCRERLGGLLNYYHQEAA